MIHFLFHAFFCSPLGAAPAAAVPPIVNFHTETLQITDSVGSALPGTSTTNFTRPTVSVGIDSPTPGLRLGIVPMAVSTDTLALWRFDDNPVPQPSSTTDVSANLYQLGLDCIGIDTNVPCSSPTFAGADLAGGALKLGLSLDALIDENTMYAYAPGGPFSPPALTAELWVQVATNSVQSYQTLMDKASASGPEYGLFLDPGGHFICRTNDGSPQDLVSVATATAGDFSWNHVACVFKGGGGGFKRLYVNGRLDSQQARSGALDPTPLVNTNGGLTFGWNPDEPGAFVAHRFWGVIAEARIVSRALGSDEIAGDYLPGSVRFSTSGPSGPYTGFITDPSQVQLAEPPAFLTDPTVLSTVSASATIDLLSCSNLNFAQFIAQDTLGLTYLSPAYQILVATNAPPARAPAAVTPTNLGVTSMTWTWGSSPCDGSYNVFTTTTPNPSLLAVTGSPSLTELGLATNTAYALDLLAVNATGQSVLTAPATYFTRSTIPQGSTLVSVASSAIHVSWSANGNPPYTPYRVSYSKVGGSSSTLVVQTPEASLTNLAFLTTYFIEVQAYNGNSPAIANSTPTSKDVLLSTFTPDAVLIAGAGSTETLHVSGPLRNRNLLMDVSPGTFAGPFAFDIVDSSAFPCGAIIPGGVSSAGVTITVLPAQQPLLPITLQLSYSAAETAGAVPSRLALVRYDELLHQCLPLATTVDTAAKTVTARVNHLSTFQIIQASPAPGTLDAPRVYPNPLFPTRGQGYFTVKNVPPGTAMRVYSLRGELLASTTADNNGLAIWEAVNASGNKVASGIYLCVLESAGTKKILKLAVER